MDEQAFQSLGFQLLKTVLVSSREPWPSSQEYCVCAPHVVVKYGHAIAVVLRVQSIEVVVVHLVAAPAAAAFHTVAVWTATGEGARSSVFATPKSKQQKAHH